MSRQDLRIKRPFLAQAVGELPTLIYGVEAGWNQIQIMQDAASLAGTQREYLAMAGELAAWAWQQRPLDKTALQSLVTLQKQAPALPAQGRKLVEIFNRHLQAPTSQTPDIDLQQTVLEALEEQHLPAVLLELVAMPGEGLFWLEQLFGLFLDEGAFEKTLELLESTPTLGSLTHLRQRLRAEWAMAALPLDEAMLEVDLVDAEVFPHWKLAARAMLLARQASQASQGCRGSAGARQEAGEGFRELWRRLPWHVNACLTAYELLHPLPSAEPLEPNAVCILLYSWNKAEDLRRTLDSLAASDIAGATVVCLDNGSSDATPQVLAEERERWQRHGGLPELELVRLPVNIGAPGARQWLLQLPQARQAQFVAFLDDDIFLPTDWLGHLVARAMDQPRAGAVGCRVVRNKRPHLLQAADFNLLPPSLCGSGFTDFQENVFPCNNGQGRRDSELFGYSRPCVSLTGCCHLLRRESLDRHGGFDIRFSPSQFDDLERDMRAFAAGEVNFYHGALAVRHVQHSSLGQATDSARQSHIHGNKVKLEHLFERKELERMAARNKRMLENDFAAKAVALEG